ncbi:hypothetical protein DERP_011154 [Dermatophagoides pteronyssinus]|uniref:Uncharacterized protein n=1 Tax=Dermatophagoides pteronyssinus TaxID=6956 RepID=A0ABQ8J923_DERPT|nr:hypothetical protein DERP_011154 [Dermatophagoides pteronyssinus]
MDDDSHYNAHLAEVIVWNESRSIPFMTVMMIERAEVYVDDQNGNEKQTSDEKEQNKAKQKICPLLH